MSGINSIGKAYTGNDVASFSKSKGEKRTNTEVKDSVSIRCEREKPADSALRRYGRNLWDSTKHGAKYYMEEILPSNDFNPSMAGAIISGIAIGTVGMAVVALGGIAGACFGLFGSHIDKSMQLPLINK